MCAPAESMPPSSSPRNIRAASTRRTRRSIGLVVDNSDQFTSASLEAEMQSLVDALNAPVIQLALVKQHRA